MPVGGEEGFDRSLSNLDTLDNVWEPAGDGMLAFATRTVPRSAGPACGSVTGGRLRSSANMTSTRGIGTDLAPAAMIDAVRDQFGMEASVIEHRLGVLGVRGPLLLGVLKLGPGQLHWTPLDADQLAGRYRACLTARPPTAAERSAVPQPGERTARSRCRRTSCRTRTMSPREPRLPCPRERPTRPGPLVLCR